MRGTQQQKKYIKLNKKFYFLNKIDLFLHNYIDYTIFIGIRNELKKKEKKLKCGKPSKNINRNILFIK